MAEYLSEGESDYGSDRSNSVDSEGELSLSCEFSSFEGGSSGSEEADSETVATVEPYQYEPVDSHSSGGTDSPNGSSDEDSAGAERLLNTEWYVNTLRLMYDFDSYG